MKRLLRWLLGDAMGLRSIDGYAAPDSIENRTNIARFGVQQGIGVATVALVGLLGVVVTGARTPGFHTAAVIALVAASAVVWGPFLWFGVRRLAPVTIPLMAFATVVLLTVLAFLMGPSLSILTTLGYVMVGVAAFVSYERRAAFVYSAFIAIGYGTVVIWQKGNTAPFTRWFVAVGAVVVVGTTVAWLVDRVRELADAERRASAEAQHAREKAEQAQAATEELNRTLEQRVEDQVWELERLGRLRRFLSPQVAEAVLSSGEESLLEPHRRQVAVLFCDLRGLTGFATAVEPEDVIDVLRDYYETVVDVLDRAEATVGSFAGDGIMAYFNDPVPRPDPTGMAVSVALELRAPMAELLRRWERKGFKLG